MERIHFVGKLANALSPGKSEILKLTIAEMVPRSIPVVVAYEIVLQSYLFFGYAQAIESAKIFSQTMSERGFSIPHPPDTHNDNISIRQRGEELCRKIYSPNYERLVVNMALVSAELSSWMIEEGYGKVLSRPGPTELEREIASIIFLAISGHSVQLYSHVRGARNLGATRELLVSIAEGSNLEDSQMKLIRGTIDKVYAT